MQALKGLNERFGGLFTQRAEEDDEGDGEAEEGDRQRANGFARWGWLITLDNIADGDYTKWQHFYDINVIEFLTVCSYHKAKNEEREYRQELARLQSGR